MTSLLQTDTFKSTVSCLLQKLTVVYCVYDTYQGETASSHTFTTVGSRYNHFFCLLLKVAEMEREKARMEEVMQLLPGYENGTERENTEAAEEEEAEIYS